VLYSTTGLICMLSCIMCWRPWDFRWRFLSTIIINLCIPLLFKDFVTFVRDSQISTQIDLPANYCSHFKRVKSYIYHANRCKRCEHSLQGVVCTKISSFSSIESPKVSCVCVHVHTKHTCMCVQVKYVMCTVMHIIYVMCVCTHTLYIHVHDMYSCTCSMCVYDRGYEQLSIKFISDTDIFAKI
jgi:hypothetical protein